MQLLGKTAAVRIRKGKRDEKNIANSEKSASQISLIKGFIRLNATADAIRMRRNQ